MALPGPLVLPLLYFTAAALLQVHHSLELSSKQRQKIATYYRQLLRGRVLERWPCPHDARLHAPSVAGLPYCYRYTALTHYMQWPEDVHPSCREIYLCNAEFEALFGMTYCEFSAKPAWRRLQLKQQLHLF